MSKNSKASADALRRYAQEREKAPPAAPIASTQREAALLELEWCEREFFKGDRGIILYAVVRSCSTGVPLPRGLLETLNEAIRKRTNFEVQTLDEALGLNEPRTKTTAKQKRWFRKDPGTGENLIFKILRRIEEIRCNDQAEGKKSKATWVRREVAKEFGVSERTILSMQKKGTQLLKGN